MGIILNRKDYNKTLVFGSHNPYDFGLYNGKRRSSQLVSQLETHAPVYVQSGERWYLTTCGWPFAASLTGGEAAWAELKWDDGE
jgi:beta-fructofuranosidase